MVPGEFFEAQKPWACALQLPIPHTTHTFTPSVPLAQLYALLLARVRDQHVDPRATHKHTQHPSCSCCSLQHNTTAPTMFSSGSLLHSSQYQASTPVLSELRAAGLATSVTQTAKDALTWSSDRPATPEHLRPYQHYARRPPGSITRNPAAVKEGDSTPSDRVFGCKTKASKESAAECMALYPDSEIGRWKLEQSETVYARCVCVCVWCLCPRLCVLSCAFLCQLCQFCTVLRAWAAGQLPALSTITNNNTHNTNAHPTTSQCAQGATWPQPQQGLQPAGGPGHNHPMWTATACAGE